MKKNRLFLFTVAAVLVGGIALVKAQSMANSQSIDQNLLQSKTKKVLYFNPEVYPDLEEIKEPTNTAFFSAVSDFVTTSQRNRMIRVETPMPYENTDAETIRDYCKNNNADYAVIPKVRYFKVGFGQYVFSNQVVVSMKLYDAQGNYISESNYDTYRRNMRLMGSTENSVRIGASGAIKDMQKNIRKAGRAAAHDL